MNIWALGFVILVGVPIVWRLAWTGRCLIFGHTRVKHPSGFEPDMCVWCDNRYWPQ